ncbi:ALP1-like protein, partial [Tanacetum coccineum]
LRLNDDEKKNVALFYIEENLYEQENIIEAVSPEMPIKMIDNISEFGGVYFVYGYGGTGKTFLWKTLAAAIRRKGDIVLNVASSGIASLLEGVEVKCFSERTSRTALDHFCQAVMEIYGPEFLRKPTVTDIEKLYRHHEEKHGFPGMLGSLDCTNWE